MLIKVFLQGVKLKKVMKVKLARKPASISVISALMKTWLLKGSQMSSLIRRWKNSPRDLSSIAVKP